MAQVSKTDIWNVFRKRNGWKRVDVSGAVARLSPSSVRYWETKGWLGREKVGDVEYLFLTGDGVLNLEQGIQSRLKNHPGDKEKLSFFPRRLAALVAVA